MNRLKFPELGVFEVKVLVTDGKDYVIKEWALTVNDKPLQYGITGAATGVINRGRASLLGWLKSLF